MSVQWWQARLYRDAAAWDPFTKFFRVVQEYLQPSFQVLDVGAGAGTLNQYTLKGKVAKIVGVDLDPRVATNPLLDEGVVADITDMPFPADTFDLIFCVYVLEHIEYPDRFVAELHRVLKPGGYFLALTPNRYHYVSLVSSLTPTSFHRWYNKRRGRHAEDTFPTFYRMNSRGALRRQFHRAGFEETRLDTIEVQPNYLTFSTPTFLLGSLYERVVNSSQWFSAFRVNLIGVFRKDAKPSN